MDFAFSKEHQLLRKAFREFHAFDFFRKEQFDSEEFRKAVHEAVEQATREHGIASLDEVLLAGMEVDGSISIIPKSSPAVRTKRRFRQRRLG